MMGIFQVLYAIFVAGLALVFYGGAFNLLWEIVNEWWYSTPNPRMGPEAKRFFRSERIKQSCGVLVLTGLGTLNAWIVVMMIGEVFF